VPNIYAKDWTGVLSKGKGNLLKFRDVKITKFSIASSSSFSFLDPKKSQYVQHFTMTVLDDSSCDK